MAEGPSESPHKIVLEASVSGDLTHMLSFFADDAVLMPPNDTALFGKEEITEWWKEYFQWFKPRKAVETERNLTVAGDQAFLRTTVSAVIVPIKKGDPIQDEIRALYVWRKQPDGAWKITHQIWNSTKPVGSGTNRYISRIKQKEEGK
jgi:uncharacterized protein (TIGR02246 family)